MVFKKCWKTGYICCLLLMTVATSPIVERKISDAIESGTNQQVEKKPKSLTISIKRPEPIHESFDDTLTDDEAEALIPKALKRRMGRFLFDFLDNSGSDSYGGYTSGDTGKDIFSSLFNLNLDTNSVMTGVLAPENIAIHVAQNAVNFMSSSLAWAALGALTSRTEVSRKVSNAPTYELPDDYVAYGTTSMPTYGYASSSKVRSSDGDSTDESLLSKKDTVKSPPKNIVYMNRNSGQEVHNDINQEEMEREKLYEIQVQEYRRRKKLEQQLRLQNPQEAASEQVAVISDRRKDSNPFRSHPTLTPEEKIQQKSNQDELDRRLMKIESYKKYLVQQQQSRPQLSQQNEPSEAYTGQGLDKQEVQQDVLVKKKGPFVTTRGGNVVRRVRKIIKKPSSSH